MKKILVFTLLSCAAQSYAQHFASLAACNSEGRNYFESAWYKEAQTTFQTCHKMAPKDTDTLINLAGALLIQNKYSEAKPFLESAVKLLDSKSPYLSYCYSRLGDIAVEENKYILAGEYYDTSLLYNRANVNSIVGKGVVLEAQGQTMQAAQMYTLALDLAPHEIIARDKLRALEPQVFTDDEILNALKERKALNPKTPALTPELRVLFNNIHRAELRGDIEFLLKAKPNSEQYVIIKDKSKSSYRAMFTLDGFILAQQLIADNAKKVFARIPGVNSINFTEMKSLDGKPVFTPEGLLTDEGRAAYDAALQGKKAFLFPGEAGALSTAAQQKIAAYIKKIKAKGYIQITADEYNYLKDRTRCSPATLQKPFGLIIWSPVKGDVRYFIKVVKDISSQMGQIYNYILEYRANRAAALESAQTGYNFFGAYGGGVTICDEKGRPAHGGAIKT